MRSDQELERVKKRLADAWLKATEKPNFHGRVTIEAGFSNGKLSFNKVTVEDVDKNN